jgi:hypothetical protein
VHDEKQSRLGATTQETADRLAVRQRWGTERATNAAKALQGRVAGTHTETHAHTRTRARTHAHPHTHTHACTHQAGTSRQTRTAPSSDALTSSGCAMSHSAVGASVNRSKERTCSERKCLGQLTHLLWVQGKRTDGGPVLARQAVNSFAGDLRVSRAVRDKGSRRIKSGRRMSKHTHQHVRAGAPGPRERGCRPRSR